MPGFGAGPFGSEPFGEWKWSKRVLFEYIPESYRAADEEAGGLLEVFAESLRPSFDELRRQIRSLEDVRSPFDVRTQFDETLIIHLGPRLLPVGELEQRGIDARVDAINRFIAPKGRFTAFDIGKEITVFNSLFPENNKTVVIASIVNTTTVLTEPNYAVDAGLLTWELRPTVEAPSDSITVQVRGDVAEVKPGWILNDGAADYTVTARRTFPSLDNDPTYLTEREGSDGFIGAGPTYYFTSPTAAFVQNDVGKVLSISNSVIPTNNTRWEILEVVSATEAVVENADGSAPTETGVVFFWALLPFSELDVSGTIEPRGTVQLSGVQGAITVAGPPAEFQLTDGTFTADDVGKLLTVRGSATPSNNDIFEIVSFIADDTVGLDATLTVDVGPLTWEMRESTTFGDFTQVQMRASSLITRLAPDFGIEIDQQESEDRQRSWVANVSQWIKQKGIAKAYQILGNISGFDVEVNALYRITVDIAELFTAENLVEVGESSTDRSGADGTLSKPASLVRFSSPTAVFKASDVGNHIRIREAAEPANNKLYTIDAFVNTTTVEMRVLDTVTLPEANNGALQWAVVKLYALRPPKLPNFDEFDADFMEELIDGLPVQTTDKFGVDKFCFEDDFFADVEIGVSTVTPLSPGVYQITATDGPAQGPSGIVGTADVVEEVRNWKFIDFAGQEFFVETIPVPSGPDFLFEVKSSVAPVTGAAILRYVCPTNLTCDYCAASRVLIKLTAGTILDETGVAVENALDRVLLRLEQVTPVHVLLVPVFSQDIECTLSLTCSVDPGEILASIYAPKDAYFDDVPADIIVADPNDESTTIPHVSAAGQADYPYTDLVFRCTVETP
jgi:hypothetical protein